MTSTWLASIALAAMALTSGAHAADPTAPAPANGAPAPLVLYFDTGSASVRADDQNVLDHASRLFTEGKPIVMIVSGATDSVGEPDRNLMLSERRATTVVNALIARGIPADRLQVLAKGETEPAVQAGSGADEPRNRRVEITWR